MVGVRNLMELVARRKGKNGGWKGFKGFSSGSGRKSKIDNQVVLKGATWIKMDQDGSRWIKMDRDKGNWAGSKKQKQERKAVRNS